MTAEPIPIRVDVGDESAVDPPASAAEADAEEKRPEGPYQLVGKDFFVDLKAPSALTDAPLPSVA